MGENSCVDRCCAKYWQVSVCGAITHPHILPEEYCTNLCLVLWQHFKLAYVNAEWLTKLPICKFLTSQILNAGCSNRRTTFRSAEMRPTGMHWHMNMNFMSVTVCDFISYKDLDFPGNLVDVSIGGVHCISEDCHAEE